jgi:hypothetical protein
MSPIVSSALRRPFSLYRGMEREIMPEPSPEDEEAIEAALARLLAERTDPFSAWWREGVRENVEPDV